jgi:cation diffusion facilitator family transporter
MTNALDRGIRSAQVGVLVNALLAIAKMVAGVVGHSYALVADSVESTADIFSSLIVWGGLKMAGRDPDDTYPFGYGKAESLAAAVIALMLLAAAGGIALTAANEIRTPHHTPAPWTLGVLVAVVLIKWTLSRRVLDTGTAIGSTAVQADAWHHLSDALTSAAAFIGITIALIGGPGWESADDWAALLATIVIGYNGLSMLRLASRDLMDRSASAQIVHAVDRAACTVAEVRATEKLAVRKAGMSYRVTLHVQADPMLTLRDAHVVSGKVKAAIRAALPQVQSVLVHMEPFERPQNSPPGPGP